MDCIRLILNCGDASCRALFLYLMKCAAVKDFTKHEYNIKLCHLKGTLFNCLAWKG